jgi:hypothetical protein
MLPVLISSLLVAMSGCHHTVCDSQFNATWTVDVRGHHVVLAWSGANMAVQGGSTSTPLGGSGQWTSPRLRRGPYTLNLRITPLCSPEPPFVCLLWLSDRTYRLRIR